MVIDLVRCDVPADWTVDFSQCLYEWQGLEAGGIALLAAVLTVLFIRKQIGQADRHERDRLRRRHQAVKATLPLTLSGICEWSRKMALELDRAKQEIERVGAAQFAGQFEPPAPPEEHVVEIQAIIETTDDGSVIEPLTEVIRELQTLWARTAELNDAAEMQRRVGIEENLDSYIIQTVQIYGLTESLFDYARGKAARGPDTVEWERVAQFLMRLGIETETLFAFVERQCKHGPTFWTKNDR